MGGSNFRCVFRSYRDPILVLVLDFRLRHGEFVVESPCVPFFSGIPGHQGDNRYFFKKKWTTDLNLTGIAVGVGVLGPHPVFDSKSREEPAFW
jgi:hypothetical protein